MTDAINNFALWYQGLPRAAQIGIPVAGAAGALLIAKHKSSGPQGSQVYGPGSSQGGGTVTGPGNNGIAVTPPGPIPPGSPPPNPIPYTRPLLKPPPGSGTGGGSTGGGGKLPPVLNNTPERSPLPALAPPPKPATNPYYYPTAFGKPLPGANHPIYTGQGNAYIVNGQDIALSGRPPTINPTVQIGPTAAQQRQHVGQSDVSSPVSKAPASAARQQQRAGFAYHYVVPPKPAPVVRVQHPPGAIQRGGRMVF